MNSNVFKIISQLVKRLLYDEEPIINSKKLINSLYEEGYDLYDINQAIEFIFSSSEKISSSGVISKEDIKRKRRPKRRVFDFREKFKFTLKVKGIIIKLNFLGLVDQKELERIISSSLTEYNKIIGVVQFWEILKEVIDDEIKLSMIIEEIPEFKSISCENIKYIN